MSNYIDLVPDLRLFSSGIIKYIQWEYNKYPHILISGSTGSGKTYFLKILLGRISKYIDNSEIVLCDFKADTDFSFCKGHKNFYRFNECSDGLDYAIALLQKRQQDTECDKHFFALVFDEWASFVTSLDKKNAESAKQQLSMLLMLGRSFNIHIILSQQRCDANYFNSARDNFSVVVGLGTLSKESINMIFSDYKDEINPIMPQGQGSIILGNQFHELIVPMVCDTSSLHHDILSIL